VTKVQALWRGILQRRKFEKMKAEARQEAERTRKVYKVVAFKPYEGLAPSKY